MTWTQYPDPLSYVTQSFEVQYPIHKGLWQYLVARSKKDIPKPVKLSSLKYTLFPIFLSFFWHRTSITRNHILYFQLSSKKFGNTLCASFIRVTNKQCAWSIVILFLVLFTRNHWCHLSPLLEAYVPYHTIHCLNLISNVIITSSFWCMIPLIPLLDKVKPIS